MTNAARGFVPRSFRHRAAVSLAIAATSGMGLIAVAAPALADSYPPAPPACSVASSSNTPNSPVTITGIGFTPGTTVTVGSTGSGIITNASTVVAGDGSVTVIEEIGQPGPAQFPLSGTPTSASCAAESSVAPTPPPTTPPTTPATTPPASPAPKTTPGSIEPKVQVKGENLTRPKVKPPVSLVVQPVGALAYTGTNHIGTGIDIGAGLIIAGAVAILISRRRSAA